MGGRPRTWEELRRRVLEEDYLSVADMEDRRQKARLLVRAPWAIPILVAGALPALITGADGIRLWLAVSLAGAVYGTLSLWRLGVRWEPRAGRS